MRLILRRFPVQTLKLPMLVKFMPVMLHGAMVYYFNSLFVSHCCFAPRLLTALDGYTLPMNPLSLEINFMNKSLQLSYVAKKGQCETNGK